MSQVPKNPQDMVTKHGLYLEKTLNGKIGKTGQFRMTSAKIVGLIQLMQRVVRINDKALYLFALFEVTSIFFMTNHHNYVHWMSFYSLDLANLQSESSQLDLQKVLIEGGFIVNRTGKSFACVPIDMDLKQTINANAKCQLKGNVTFADISKVVCNLMKSDCLNEK